VEIEHVGRPREFAINWDALGAIAELAGALAVFATLIYLALQIRQYSDGMNSATIQQNMIAFNDINSMLGSDPSLAAIIEQGNDSPEELSEEELRSYTWIMRSFVNLYENLFEQFQRGNCPPSFWHKSALELKAISATPGMKLFREQNTFHEELFEFIDRMEEDPGKVITLNLKS